MRHIARIPLKSVPLDAAFMFDNSTTVFEYRGNGWYQAYGQTETGGPWVADGETIVTIEVPIPEPSQTLFCFI